jgi:uncharacterized protein (TIGR00725 family)
MPTAGRVAIIAVFGGSDPRTLRPAEYVGYEIARQECILLAGGTDNAGAAVKEKAIAGVKSTPGARWIGVGRSKKIGRAVCSQQRIILWPGYEHKRNYVEAHLCDAAVAFPGGDGTASEVAFCLALGRPVILVGEGWQTEYPLAHPHRERTLEKLRYQTLKRIQRDEVKPSPLDAPIAAALNSLSASLPSFDYRHLPQNGEARRIVEQVLHLIGGAGQLGEFPNVARYSSMAADYNSWLGL